MTRNAQILKELEQISPAVANLNIKIPYSVPVNYFETLSSVIMARIAAGGIEENSLLNIAGNQMPQKVPAGYFDTISDNILSKLKTQNELSVADELQELSSTIAGIVKTNVYEVPAGYFENFSVSPPVETKVVSMFSKKVWMHYAAAAVVFVLIAFGINFFTEQSVITNSIAAVPKILTEEQFNKELSSISDDEIINYLKLTSDNKDAVTIAKLVNKSELPEEAEYMDEEFLESFMRELEQQGNKIN